MLLVSGLIAYAVGGTVFLVGMIEFPYPFLAVDRVPVLNLLLTLTGIVMVVMSLPLLLLAIFFSQDGIDNVQVILTTVLGAIGLALVRISVLKIL